MRLFRSGMLVLPLATTNASLPSKPFRGIQRLLSSNLKVFHITPDGHREEIEGDSEDHLEQALCSEKLVSRLHHCDDSSTTITTHPESPPTEHMYPMAASYTAAVASGHACPLPAPFMHIVNSKCCVTRDENIWPNVCPTKHLIGTSTSPSAWHIRSNIDTIKSLPLERLIPAGTYKVGRPDIPTNYSHWKPSFAQLLIYFIMSMATAVLLAYIFNKLDEEQSISKGQKREELFFKSRQHDVEDSDTSSLSPSGSAYIQHRVNESTIGELKISEQISTAFGLLPGLPRGRSVAGSSLNSPRQRT